MGNGHLWLLSADGVPYRVTADAKIEHISDAQWKPEPAVFGGQHVKLCQIVSAPQAAFALDSLGAVYQFVLSSHLTIRQKVEVYSNQRWYPMIGWSSRTLPTDRGSFSNEDGSKSGELSGFHLKSDGWRWEEPWTVDVDVRKHDKDGWEYATNFSLAVWRPENGVGSFVRRRRWKRHMRYTALERWAELPRLSEAIVDLAVGGFDILPEKQCLLFALSNGGNLLRRVGIHANNPDGDDWQEIDGIVTEEEREKPTKISCSPSLGTLLVLTWDGRLFLRSGVSRETLNGVSWSRLMTPNDHPTAFAAIGTDSLWTTTADGKLWMKRLDSQCAHEPSSFSASKYTEVGQGIYRVCLNKKDQLVGVSDNGGVYVRVGVSVAEPSGRTFLRIVERIPPKQRKWIVHWVADHVVVSNRLNFKDAEWRRKILEELRTVSDVCWEAFNSLNDLEDLVEDEGKSDLWNRKCKANLRKFGERRFVAGMVYLSADKIMVHSNTGVRTLSKSLDELMSAVCKFDHGTSSFTIFVRFIGESLELGYTEETVRDEWHELLQQVRITTVRIEMEPTLVDLFHESFAYFFFENSQFHRNFLAIALMMTFSEIRRRFLATGDSLRHHALWTVSKYGLIQHHMPIKEFSDSTTSSLCIPGCMKYISAGAEGIVWTLSSEGTVYALSPEYSPVCGNITNLSLLQKCEVVRKVVEYQRHAFLRGFITFCEPSLGIFGWMEGSDSVDGLYHKLPSRDWSWIDPDWRLADVDASEDGWAYSDVIDGEYDFGRKKGRFRRRIWKRRCLYTGRGPWITVESPPLCCIEVQKADADRILVWAVTTNGQVIVRQGVTPGHPQGTIWKHITSDHNIVSISVASPTCVWATTVEGRLLRRECYDQTDMECIDWAEVLYTPMKKVFCFCASSEHVFILPEKDPSLIVIDVKRGLSKACIALPKAIHLSLDHENSLCYCDGSEVVKLGRSSISGYYVLGRVSVKNCSQFCFS